MKSGVADSREKAHSVADRSLGRAPPRASLGWRSAPRLSSDRQPERRKLLGLFCRQSPPLDSREKAVKRPKNLGLLLLAVWLILTGLLPFLRVSIPYSSTILPLLAVGAGILILLER